MDDIDDFVRSFRATEGLDALEAEGRGVTLGWLNKGSPYRHLVNFFHKMREGRRREGGRRLSSEDPSKDGLLEVSVEEAGGAPLKSLSSRNLTLSIYLSISRALTLCILLLPLQHEVAVDSPQAIPEGHSRRRALTEML